MSISNKKGAITAGINTQVTAKVTVLAATDVALPANTYDNGVSGVGATMTADINGALPTIDGIAPIVGSRLLIRNEAGLENGYYDVTDLGSAGSKWILTRSSDADISEEIDDNSNVWVSQGTLFSDQIFTLTTDGPIAIGTTPLTFEIASASLAELGVRSSASAFDLQFKSSEALTANHSLSYILGDTDRTLSILADVALDQDLQVADSPEFTGLGIGTSSIDSSALIELASTSKGMLSPRMTTIDRDLIASPATGLGIYDLTLNSPAYFDGSSWQQVANLADIQASDSWSEALAIDNTSGANDVVIDTGQKLTVDLLEQTITGGLRFDMSVANKLTITTDDGGEAESGLLIAATEAQLFANGFERIIDLESGGDISIVNEITGDRKISLTLGNGEIVMVDSGASDFIGVGGTAFPVIITSQSARIKTGVRNTVILGGTNIIAKSANTAYVKNLGFYETGTIEGLLSQATLTADRAWSLPNASGTIALGTGVNFGPSAVTSITVVNGIITAIS